MIAAAARSQKPGRRPPRSQFGYGQSHIGCGVLNRREREVIMETCLGLTNKEFARKLEIGLHTAATDRKRAYQRLGVNNSRDLIKAVLFPN